MDAANIFLATLATLVAIVVIVIFVAVVGATVLVIVAVHREERLRSLNDRAPGMVARLARMLLGVYAPRETWEIFTRPENPRPPRQDE